MTFPVFLSWIIFYVSLRLSLEPTFIQALGMDPKINQEIQNLKIIIQQTFDSFFVVNIVLFLLFIIPLGVIVTNRLAGPMYRLKKHLREKNQGPFPTFRKYDFFSELPLLLEDYIKNKK